MILLKYLGEFNANVTWYFFFRQHLLPQQFNSSFDEILGDLGGVEDPGLLG